MVENSNPYLSKFISPWFQLSVHVPLNGAWKCTITKKHIRVCSRGSYHLKVRSTLPPVSLCFEYSYKNCALLWRAWKLERAEFPPRQGHTFHISPQQTINGANALGTPKITPKIILLQHLSFTSSKNARKAYRSALQKRVIFIKMKTSCFTPFFLWK